MERPAARLDRGHRGMVAVIATGCAAALCGLGLLALLGQQLAGELLRARAAEWTTLVELLVAEADPLPAATLAALAAAGDVRRVELREATPGAPPPAATAGRVTLADGSADSLVTVRVPLAPDRGGGRELALEIGPGLALLRLRAAWPAALAALAAVLAAVILAQAVAARRRLAELARSAGALRAMAFRDELTGLFNRHGFDRLAVDHGARAGARALLLLDLDGFRALNESLGTAAGDELLKVVADRLRRAVRESDAVARIGADEFAVLLEEIDGPDAALAAARRLIAAAGAAVLRGGHDLQTSVSCGVALLGRGPDAARAALRDAELALEQARAEAGGGCVMFDVTLRRAADRRAALEAELRSALAEGSLTMHYQPVIAAADGRLVGFEGLLRWPHAERGMLSAAQFLPVAEAAGLGTALSEVALGIGLRQLARLQREGLGAVRLSLNIAAGQLADEGFVDRLARRLLAERIEPRQLVLEITEGVVLGRGDDRIQRHLQRLRGLGVRLSLDDFGTGYASLTHLRSLPVDEIKIDRGFVAEIEADPEDAAIVEGVLLLARALGLEVVAEGVETTAQRDFLRARACTYLQGWLYGTALPADAAMDLARSAGVLPAGRVVA
jgi:diguanylate cyclase (GGDEF)-like protein